MYIQINNMTNFLMVSGPQILIVLAVMLIPLIALIDILKNKFEGNNKIIWVLVALFFPFIGAILYFSIGRNQRIKI